MGAVLRDLIFDIGLPREYRAGRRIDIFSPDKEIALLGNGDWPHALSRRSTADHRCQSDSDADLQTNGSHQAHGVLPVRKLRVSTSHAPQYAACPGVLGNGIASRTFASPVT